MVRTDVDAGSYTHSSLVVLPDDDVLLVTGSLYWRSSDNGLSWSTVAPTWGELPASGAYQLLATPTDSLIAISPQLTRVIRSVAPQFGSAWEVVATSVPWASRARAGIAIRADGGVLVAGGTRALFQFGDVWLSEDDGRTWQRLTSAAAWAARESCSLVGLSNGDVLMVGGRSTAAVFRDVWRSSDGGATFTELAVPPWEASYAMSIATHGTVVVVAGGTTSGGFVDTLYQSTDNGDTWELLSTPPGWTPRISPAMVALPDGAVLLAGGHAGVSSFGGVWLRPGAPANASWTWDVCSAPRPALCRATPGSAAVRVSMSQDTEAHVLPGVAIEGGTASQAYYPPTPSLSLAPWQPSITEAPTLDFLVTFQRPVVGLTATDFDVSGGTVLLVSAPGAGGAATRVWHLSVTADAGQVVEGTCPNGYTRHPNSRLCGRSIEALGTWEEQQRACAPFHLAMAETEEESSFLASLRQWSMDPYWYVGGVAGVGLHCSGGHSSTVRVAGWEYRVSWPVKRSYGVMAGAALTTPVALRLGWVVHLLPLFHRVRLSAQVLVRVHLFGSPSWVFVFVVLTVRGRTCVVADVPGVSWSSMPSISWAGDVDADVLLLPSGVLVAVEQRSAVPAAGVSWVSNNGGHNWDVGSTDAPKLDGAARVVTRSGSLLLLGGNDVESGLRQRVHISEPPSPGHSWSLFTAFAPWPARHGLAAIALRDGMLLLCGGEGADGLLNDVWTSVDEGLEWTQVTDSAAWSARSGHKLVELPDGMVLLAGSSDGSPEVWATIDRGVSFQQLPDAPWDGHAVKLAEHQGMVVAVVGTAATVYVSQDRAQSWSASSASPWFWGSVPLPAVTMFPDGRIYIAGGSASSDAYMSAAVNNTTTTWQDRNCRSRLRALCTAPVETAAVQVSLGASAGEIVPPNAAAPSPVVAVFSPPVPSIAPSVGQAPVSDTNVLQFDVEFSKPVVGLQPTDFVVSSGSYASRQVQLAGNGSSYQVSVTVVGACPVCPAGFVVADSACIRQVSTLGTLAEQAVACAPYTLAVVDEDLSLAMASAGFLNEDFYWFDHHCLLLPVHAVVCALTLSVRLRLYRVSAESTSMFVNNGVYSPHDST